MIYIILHPVVCNPCSFSLSNQLYQQVVADVAEKSMKAAVERVKESSHHATSGVVRVQHLNKSLFLYLLYSGL